MNMRDSRFRSVAKAMSWRVLASLTTFLATYFVTGSFSFAGSVAAIEIFSKIVLYYLHERLWSHIPWGREETAGA